MVTMVGMQKDFGDAMKELLELEYDALAAYDESIARLENADFKHKMSDFRDDHKHHIQKISQLLKSHGVDFEPGPDAKKFLTQGKVVIADLLGDTAILKAMLTNEIETNMAYERMHSHEHIWDDAIDFIKEGFADEKKHKAWLESI